MDDLSKLSKDELISYIEDLKKQLNNGKYGLYFDRKAAPEEIVLKCSKEIPVLVHNKSKDLVKNGVDNILIEGDNFAVLSALNTVYPDGFVDVIYIDPPYNTGSDGDGDKFIYNDKFIDKEDGFRHTTWLNFMEKRLALAKNLMKADGFIFISIDDHEQAQLKMLCDEIFGSQNFVCNFIRTKKTGSAHDARDISVEYDYMLFYAKNRDSIKVAKQKVDTSVDTKYKYSDKHVSRRGKYYLRDLDYKGTYSAGMDYPINIKGKDIYPGGKYGKPNTWRWSKQKVEWGIQNDFIYIDEKKKKIYIKQYEYVNENDELRERELPYNAQISFLNSTGSSELKKILNDGSVKIFPKPVDLIKFAINLKAEKDITVMDFFAGSGTTAQAVLELNKEDGGNRRFILCTNNENNIMTDVCYPRIKTVLTGIRPDGSKYSDGLSGNLRYFKVDFVEDSPYKEQTKYNLADQCDGLLCILESCFDKYSGGRDYNIYLNSKKDKSLSIFNNNYEEKEFDEMLSIVLSSSCKENVVYYFSLDSNIDPNIEKIVKSKLPEADVKPIPSKIYEIYKKIEDDVRRKY